MGIRGPKPTWLHQPLVNCHVPEIFRESVMRQCHEVDVLLFRREIAELREELAAYRRRQKEVVKSAAKRKSLTGKNSAQRRAQRRKALG